MRFAADLTSVAFAEDGGGLSFQEEAVCVRHDGLFLVLRSDYRQPFGSA